MDYLWDTLTMIGSLVLIILVLVLTYYATRWYARRMGNVGAGKHIKVLEKTTLNTGAALAIVQVGDRYYLLGVSDKSVRLLSELSEDFGQFIEEEPQQTSAPFSQVFRQLMDKTRKKDDGDGR